MQQSKSFRGATYSYIVACSFLFNYIEKIEEEEEKKERKKEKRFWAFLSGICNNPENVKNFTT